MDPLQKRLDALWDAHDSPVTEHVLDFQNAHLAHVSRMYGRTLVLFELCFDLFAEVVDGLNYADKSRWPLHRGTQLLFFLHNLKSLQSVHDRLVKGCYGDAFVLLRVPYEAFLRMVFMSLFPADAMSALSDPKPGSKNRRFNATNLVKQDLRLKWDDYKVLSVFTHAHRVTALSHAIDIRHRGRRDPLRLEHRFDDGQFTMGANLLTVVLFMFLGMLVQVFGRDVTAPPRLVERIKKVSEIADVVGAILRTHRRRRQYLPTVAKDIDDVLQLMRAADDGERWQRAWRRIRRAR